MKSNDGMLTFSIFCLIVLVITLYKMPQFIVEKEIEIVEKEIEIQKKEIIIELYEKALRASRIRASYLKRDILAQRESFKELILYEKNNNIAVSVANLEPDINNVKAGSETVD